MMASDATQLPLAERLDVHKSCKSLETLLSVFNDYCEAAGAVVTLQKKLVKALRETAGMKVTVDIAANAMNTSANIYESLSEIDSKFAKLADKEYDAVSAEVKKWFKKLNKEERAHDDRIASANARIKQAGQVYEKKSKKSPREASEEHARYINLISTLGPEISQEKYNHSLLVTQRHTATIYSVAACISRVADAEWLRTCECVRRFSPAVGKLGEWRALCEGGWTGPLPSDLPDVGTLPQPSPNELNQPMQQSAEEDERFAPATFRSVASPPEAITADVQNQEPPLAERMIEASELQDPTKDQGDVQNRRQPSPLPSPVVSQAQQLFQNRQTQAVQSMPLSSFEPPRKFTDDDNNTGSVRSLSQFPSPPTHFPIPPSLSQQGVQQSSQTLSSHSAASRVSFPTPNVNERRAPGSEDAIPEDRPSLATSPSTTLPPSPEPRHIPISAVDNVDEAKSSPMNEKLSLQPVQILDKDRDHQSESPTAISSTPAVLSSPSRDQEDKEFGADTSGYRLRASLDNGRAAGGGKAVERSDTGASNRSIVAAMRNRYSNQSGSSPPPKEVPIPRLPLSVNDLASRYQDGPSSPRMRAASPTGARPLPTLDSFKEAEASYREQSGSPKTYGSGGRGISSSSMTPTPDDDIAQRRRRQQRMDQLAELELKEKEQELRLREQEIELRARELEREKMNYIVKSRAEAGHEDGLGGPPSSPRPGLKPRERQLSFQQLRRPLSHQIDLPPARSSQYSASMTHLVPPSSSHGTEGRRSPEASIASSSSTSNHAPYCGCDACSVSKYKTSSSTYSPVQSNEKEKKGWMRRLSMPIVAGNAFLDSKRNKDGLGKSGPLSLDSKKIGNPTMLRSGATEDGRIAGGRRSYDSGGISNRSMTNVGLNTRR